MTKYVPIPKKGDLTAVFTKAVTDYLLVETPLKPADIAIVFGNNTRNHLAEKAADIYHKGLAKKLVVTGGYRGAYLKREADDVLARLLKLGVPRDAILLESQAQNTGENVIFSKQLVEKEIGLESVESVIAIGNIVAARRFLMTIERHWPGLTLMSAPINGYSASKEKWYTLKPFRNRVMKEYRKIPDYLKRGYITEVSI